MNFLPGLVADRTTIGQDIVGLMENWITKVCSAPSERCAGWDAHVDLQIGFPVLTVTETKEGIEVRQDRFLETGIAEPEENETIW